MLTLSNQERRLFAHYCQEQAANEAKLAEQMKAINVTSQMIKRMESKVAAYLIVAAELNPGEETTIGAYDVGTL